MKRLFATVLGLVLIASASVNVFAEANKGGNTGISIVGTYTPGAVAKEGIYVDVVWDEMRFNYTAPSRGEWNPMTHRYEGADPGGWEWSGRTAGKTAPSIVLTNHSNVAVSASFTFNAEVAGLSGSFSKTEMTLATAEGTEYSEAPRVETSFSLGGSGIDKAENIGMVIVTVTKSTTPPASAPVTPDEPEDPNAVSVSTAEAYKRAVEAGGAIRLANDIECYETNINFASDVVIDLNGHTLNGYFFNFTHLTLKNGKVNVKDKPIAAGSIYLTLKNCTLSGGADGKTIKGDTFAHVFFSGSVSLEYGSLAGIGEVVCLAGTYNFDPTNYIDTSAFAVIENADGTWTVK